MLKIGVPIWTSPRWEALGCKYRTIARIQHFRKSQEIPAESLVKLDLAFNAPIKGGEPLGNIQSLCASAPKAAPFSLRSRTKGIHLGIIILAVSLIATRATHAIPACPSCPQSSFGPAVRGYFAGFSTTMAPGDFNGDGIPDVALVAYNSPSGWRVELLPGDGNGQFGAPIISATTDHPFSVFAADFDNDGHLDLLVELSFSLAVLLGNGDGTFQIADPSKTISTQGPVQPVIADFNRDGVPDIAISYPSLQLFIGNGDGSFADPITIDNDDFFGAVTAGDTTGDGLNDLVVEEGGGISIFRSSGNGHFIEMPQVISHLSQPVISDFNHDGIPDIAGSTTIPNGDFGSLNAVGVALGQGGGTFGPVHTYPVDDWIHRLVAADVDHNGSVDLLALTEVNHVNIFKNQGNATFSPATILAGIYNDSTFAVADLNGDGHPDFVSASEGEVLVAMGAPDGQFTQATPTGGVVPVTAFPAATGDFDGNGQLDVVALTTGDYFSADTGRVSVLLGDGAGHLGAPLAFVAGKNPVAAGMGDFDGDGYDDLIIGTNSSPNGLIFLSLHDGHFSQAASVPVIQGPFVTADVNHDGHVDLLGTGSGGHVVVALGKGDGTFHEPVETPLPMANLEASGPGVAVGDFNKDGVLDIVSATNGFLLSFSPGNGDGTFGVPTNYPGGHGIPALAIGDFNDDGNLDVVIGSSLFLGQGNGTFTDEGAIPGVTTIINTSGACCSTILNASDVNQDGIPDLIVANVGSASAAVLVSNGDGTFASPIGYNGRTSSGMLVGDFTDDGKEDIFLGDSLLINTNCQPRRLMTVQEPSSCDTNGSTFAVPPQIGVADDGGNLLTCASDEIVVSIESGTGTTGARLNGTSSIVPRQGVAEFSDLSVNEPGSGYRLIFASGALFPAATRSITQGLTLALPGTTATCTNIPTEFAAPTNMDSYSWSLDGQVVSHNDVVILEDLTPGEHQLSATVFKDGCVATATSMVMANIPPDRPVISAPPFASIGAKGLLASAQPDADGSYLWRIQRNGSTTGGGSASQTAFDAGAPGSVVVLTALLFSSNCSASASTTVPVDFADVAPQNPFHDFIDALEKFGVTLGCGGGKYCPDQPVRRDQMAALLARAHDGSDGAIPDSGSLGLNRYDCDSGGQSQFSDVAPTSPFCKHIHRIAALGITLGCDTPSHFCPSGLVTRGQMALFIGRAVAPNATPPSSYSDGATGRSYDCSIASPFTDVAANTELCNAVGYLWAKAVVDGFGDGTFHPLGLLTRAPAAKFIANAFGLTLGP